MNTEFHNANNNLYIQQNIKAYCLKNSMIIIIENRPCKIYCITYSKSSKHPSKSIHVMTHDVFTDRKIEAIFLTSETIQIPIVTNEYYLFFNADIEKKTVTVLDNEGICKNYIFNYCEAEILQILISLNESNELNNAMVQILSCMHETRILGVKYK